MGSLQVKPESRLRKTSPRVQEYVQRQVAVQAGGLQILGLPVPASRMLQLKPLSEG